MYKCKKPLGCSGENVLLYSRDGDLGFDRCNDCGIIWRTADSAHISKVYEQFYFDSKDYSKNRKHKVKKSGWLIDLATLFHPNIKSMLEIGCSIGHTLEAANNRKIDSHGIDVSNYAVEFCNNHGLNASISSLDELKLTGKTYDLIFMQHVLEHFENPFTTMNDCNELLNEKGIAVILVPNSKYGRAVRNNSKHRFYSMDGVGSEHYAYFNYSNLNKLLQTSGFKVVQENYPIWTGKLFSFNFFSNRILRRSLSLFNSDQELIVIARKV